MVQTFPQSGGMRNAYTFFRSRIEHPCVYNALNYMRTTGCAVYDVDINRDGTINIDSFYDCLDNCYQPDKVLACIMDSNNELGTIEATHTIGEICHECGAKLMTDMTQSFAHSEDIDVTYLGMDYAFGSAQKFGAVRGAGFLYAREPKELKPFMYGGEQENGLRAGTENLAAIWAMAMQFAEVSSMRIANARKAQALKDYLLDNLPTECNTTVSSTTLTLPNLVSLQTSIDANILIAALASLERPIYLSAGSACSTDAVKPSRTLTACGYSSDIARRTIRVSLNEELTTDDIDYFIRELDNCIRLFGGAN